MTFWQIVALAYLGAVFVLAAALAALTAFDGWQSRREKMEIVLDANRSER